MKCADCIRYELCFSRGSLKERCIEFKPKKTEDKRPRKKPTFAESTLQQDCKRLFDRTHPGIAKLLFAVPNGADVTPKQREKLVAEGMTAGVSDMILLVGNGKHNCLCLEFKKKTFKVLKSGKLKQDHTHQSPKQKEWQKLVTDTGGRYEVIWDMEQFKQIVTDYLGFNNFK